VHYIKHKPIHEHFTSNIETTQTNINKQFLTTAL